jgi:undecaprenyl-diphosphatase
MDLLQTIILGIVQGISEFLPISSDGHLVLMQRLLGFEGGSLVFNVTLHAGTLLSILCFYYRDLLKMIDWNFIWLGVVSSVPTAIIGLLMKKFFDFENTSLYLVALFFAISGVALFFAQKKNTKFGRDEVSLSNVLAQIDLKMAFLIGVAQGLAVLPGLSRSGSTIATALLLGCSGPVAAFYSFAISIPAVFGACVLELSDATVSPHDMPFYFIGAAISFVVGYLALHALSFIFTKRISLAYFSYYLWALALLMVALA